MINTPNMTFFKHTNTVTSIFLLGLVVNSKRISQHTTLLIPVSEGALIVSVGNLVKVILNFFYL